MYINQPKISASPTELQKEQRKLDSLKNIGVSWVFIQPTRIKNVKISNNMKKIHKNQETFERLGAQDISFLGESSIQFSDSEIKLIMNSMNNKDTIITTDDDISSKNEIDKTETASSNMDFVEKSTTEETNPIKNEDSGRFDDELISSRIYEDFFDMDFNEKVEEETECTESNDDNKSESVITEEDRKLIVRNYTDSECKQKERSETRKIKIFEFNEIPTSNKILKDEKISLGRKKLLIAIEQSSSIRCELNSVQLAEINNSKKINEYKSVMSNSAGVMMFKQYLEQQNLPIPKELKNLKFTEAAKFKKEKTSAKTTLV